MFRTKFPKGEYDLVRGLVNLRRRTCEAPPEAVEDIFAPFLEIIISPETTGPITGAALESLSKLLRAEYIDPEQVQSPKCIQRVVEAVLNCQFEQSDIGGDEVVIGRIVESLQACYIFYDNVKFSTQYWQVFKYFAPSLVVLYCSQVAA
jgi:brefeldin A-resistance guanine nucleotide exchange factor 1